jgi:hypothetical protein
MLPKRPFLVMRAFMSAGLRLICAEGGVQPSSGESLRAVESPRLEFPDPQEVLQRVCHRQGVTKRVMPL